MGWEDYQDWSNDSDKNKQQRKRLRAKLKKNPKLDIKICSECGDPLIKREVGICDTCMNYAHANN